MIARFKLWLICKKQLHSKGKAPYFRDGEIRWAVLGHNIGGEIIGKGHRFSRPVLILRRVFSNLAIVTPLTTKYKSGSYYVKISDARGDLFYGVLAQIRYIDGKRIYRKLSHIDEGERIKVAKAMDFLLKNASRTHE